MHAPSLWLFGQIQCTRSSAAGQARSLQSFAAVATADQSAVGANIPNTEDQCETDRERHSANDAVTNEANLGSGLLWDMTNNDRLLASYLGLQTRDQAMVLAKTAVCVPSDLHCRHCGKKIAGNNGARVAHERACPQKRLNDNIQAWATVAETRAGELLDICGAAGLNAAVIEGTYQLESLGSPPRPVYRKLDHEGTMHARMSFNRSNVRCRILPVCC